MVTRGHNVNQCMAKAIKKRLEVEFSSKEWTVVVYSGQNGGADLNYVVKRCNPRKSKTQVMAWTAGCVTAEKVKFDGLDNEEPRYFHLMYRGVGEDTRDYGSVPIVNVGLLEMVPLIRMYKSYGLRTAVDEGYCYFHPMDSSGKGEDSVRFTTTDATKAQYLSTAGKMEADEGYIAFEDKKGIDMAYDAGNFTIKRETILWGGNAINKLSVSKLCTDLDTNGAFVVDPIYLIC